MLGIQRQDTVCEWMHAFLKPNKKKYGYFKELQLDTVPCSYRFAFKSQALHHLIAILSLDEKAVNLMLM